MKTQQIFFSIFLAGLLFTSCNHSDIRFINPQPIYLEPLSSIPLKFQGTFVINKDTIEVTDYTIDGDTINTDALVVKGWGNYLFVNQLDEDYYSLTCAKLVSVWNVQEITLHRFEILDGLVDDFLAKNDTTNLSELEIDNMFVQMLQDQIYNGNNNIVEIDSTDGKMNFFVLDDLSVNEFQTLLNKSQENASSAVKIK